jgi:hypothetical protein
MAVGFGTVAFDVMTDGSVPLPSREDGTGVFYYSATVKCATRADMLALQGLFSVATVLPAIGSLDLGTVVVEKGVGVRTLTYPDGAAEYTTDAILLSAVPVGRAFTAGPYLLTCRWVCPEVPA